MSGDGAADARTIGIVGAGKSEIGLDTAWKSKFAKSA